MQLHVCGARVVHKQPAVQPGSCRHAILAALAVTTMLPALVKPCAIGSCLQQKPHAYGKLLRTKNSIRLCQVEAQEQHHIVSHAAVLCWLCASCPKQKNSIIP